MSGIKLRPIVFKVEPPAPVLLYEQAVQNYAGSSMNALMTGQTWNTNKNFICYKVSLCMKSYRQDFYYSHWRGVVIGDDPTDTDGVIRFGRNSYFDYSYSPTSTFFCGKIGGLHGADVTAIYGTAGTDGQSFTEDIFQQSVADTAFKANPDIQVSTNDGVITYRIIFDKTLNKAYCYITDKQVMLFDYGNEDLPSKGIYPTTPLGDNQDQSMNSNVDFGIQVYACDSLEAAIQC